MNSHNRIGKERGSSIIIVPLDFGPLFVSTGMGLPMDRVIGCRVILFELFVVFF